VEHCLAPVFAISSGSVTVICGPSVMLVVNYGKHVVPFEILMRFSYAAAVLLVYLLVPT
jgi:hypothetical protein